MSKDDDVSHAGLEKPEFTSTFLRYAYQLLFVISVGFNVFFSVVAYVDRSKLAKLEIEKRETENRLLLAEHSPSLSSFRLIYEINTLAKFLRSGEQPPFLNENKTFRILQNDVYDQMKLDLDAIQKHIRVSSRVTFLVVANTSGNTGYAISVASPSGSKYQLGDLEGHSAVLIPLSYDNSSKFTKVGTDDLKNITYKAQVKDTFEALNWSRLSEQEFRVDKWSLCRG